VKDRINKIFTTIQTNLDAIIIKNAVYPHIDVNFFYLTGLEKGIFENCILIAYPDKTLDLIVSELEAESARKADANIYVYKNIKDLENKLRKLSSSLKYMGVNTTNISYKGYQYLKTIFPHSNFIDISKELLTTRLVKDKIEIKYIEKACNISDQVMEQIPEILHDGMYEYEIAAEIDYLMQKLGADKPAFDTISSFNKNTAEPHYSHGNTKLKKNGFALFDFGASYKKYNSDITRTFIYGNANTKQKNMYNTVLSAQKIGFDSIKPGIKANEIHNKVSSYINKTKFKGRFIHSTGHALGLSVHDGSSLSSENSIQLQENMVFTVEPGIYIPGYGGIRIEDDILVKKAGIKILTNSSKYLELENITKI
jgi:Xaa-Pro dipeptidase